MKNMEISLRSYPKIFGEKRELLNNVVQSTYSKSGEKYGWDTFDPSPSLSRLIKAKKAKSELKQMSSNV